MNTKRRKILWTTAYPREASVQHAWRFGGVSLCSLVDRFLVLVKNYSTSMTFDLDSEINAPGIARGKFAESIIAKRTFSNATIFILISEELAVNIYVCVISINFRHNVVVFLACPVSAFFNLTYTLLITIRVRLLFADFFTHNWRDR